MSLLDGNVREARGDASMADGRPPRGGPLPRMGRELDNPMTLGGWAKQCRHGPVTGTMKLVGTQSQAVPGGSRTWFVAVRSCSGGATTPSGPSASIAGIRT